MRSPPLLAVALVGVGALTFAAVDTMGQEEDSPWPRTTDVAANVRAVASVTRDLEGKVELMRSSAARYADSQACLRGVPVSEYGDPDGQFGYVYDERDGTGRGHMPALAIDRRSRRGKEDYLFLHFSRADNCGSDAPLPGGTADPASVAAAPTLDGLERRVRRLKRATRQLLASSERFDEWESCVSWVPVTEFGDPGRRFGYLFGRRGATRHGYRPALAVDRSDWDDPDYMFLAFVGGDRPGGSCRDEPGEAID